MVTIPFILPYFSSRLLLYTVGMNTLLFHSIGHFLLTLPEDLSSAHTRLSGEVPTHAFLGAASLPSPFPPSLASFLFPLNLFCFTLLDELLLTREWLSHSILNPNITQANGAGGAAPVGLWDGRGPRCPATRWGRELMAGWDLAL